MLRSVMPIWNLVCLEYNRWLLREINPLSPYACKIILRINQLERSV
jgi:hypothetical protein